MSEKCSLTAPTKDRKGLTPTKRTIRHWNGLLFVILCYTQICSRTFNTIMLFISTLLIILHWFLHCSISQKYNNFNSLVTDGLTNITHWYDKTIHVDYFIFKFFMALSTTVELIWQYFFSEILSMWKTNKTCHRDMIASLTVPCPSQRCKTRIQFILYIPYYKVYNWSCSQVGHDLIDPIKSSPEQIKITASICKHILCDDGSAARSGIVASMQWTWSIRSCPT